MIIKVAIVLPYLKRRGTEKQAFRIALYLKNNGFEPIIFNVQGWGEFQKDVEYSDIKVISVGEPERVGLKEINIKRAKQLAKLIELHKCNVILSRANMAHRISLEANKMLERPLPIALVNSGSIPSFGGSIIKYIKRMVSYNLIFYGSTKVVTVSEQAKNNLKKYLPHYHSKIVSIQNGIDLNVIEKLAVDYIPISIKSEEINITFVGSIDIERKGIDILIKSFRDLISLKLKYNIKLHIVGSGNGEDEVKFMIHKLNLNDKVICHGEVKNPYPLLKVSDIFVLSSRREGLPNSLLEAMGLGVCCIATDCETGPSEIIETYKNGILIPTENASAMTDKMKELIENERLRFTLGANGKETILGKYTIDRMGYEYASLIKNMLIEKK